MRTFTSDNFFHDRHSIEIIQECIVDSDNSERENTI